MSQAIQITRFKCSTCGHVYDSKESADRCESRPIREDRGVKVGDTVLITSGDGTGSKAEVEGVHIIDAEWGHYAADRYWHTVALTARVIDGWGNRMLTFDAYKALP